MNIVPIRFSNVLQQIAPAIRQNKIVIIAMAIFTAMTLSTCYFFYRRGFKVSHHVKQIFQHPLEKRVRGLEIRQEATDQGLITTPEQENFYKVLYATGLPENPEAFLQRWTLQRSCCGGLQQTWQDNLRDFLSTKFPHPPVNDGSINKQDLMDKREALLQKAQEEFGNTVYPFVPDYSKEACNMVLDIIDAGILINPKDYLQQWDKMTKNMREGNPIGIQQPEDDVKAFFKKELKV